MANEEESDKAMAKEYSWPMELLEPRLRGGQVCGRLGNLDQRVTGSGKGGWETLFSSYSTLPSFHILERFPGGSASKESACNAGDLGFNSCVWNMP